MPEFGDGKKPFVLTHPDFDLQNILVDEEGRVSSIIDWDGAETSAHSTGIRAYPPFLTYDWCPAMYMYRENTERKASDLGECKENSLVDLASGILPNII